MNQEAQQRILGYFIEESRDHLTTIEQGLLSLRESLADGELINELFRAAHSIKGGAAMLNLGSIQRVAHRMEDFFNIFRAREGRVPVDQHLETLLLQGYDTLAMLLEELQSPGGLTEETGRAALQNLDPVFAETERHLYSLLGEANPHAPAPVAPMAPQVDTLQVALTQRIPQHLREMLDLFKQRDQPGIRGQLVQVADRLQEIGATHHLDSWSALTGRVREAIQDPEADLRTLALIALRDLKQGQQALLDSRQVQASPELLAMTTKAAAATPESPPPLTEAQRRIMGFFLEEAQEHLQTLEQGLLNLAQQAEDPELINELFRAAHSIKGGSAQLGFDSIKRTAHRLEDCFSLFRNHPGEIGVDPDLEGLLLQGLDGLSRQVNRLQELGFLPEAEGDAVWVEVKPALDRAMERIQQLLAGEVLAAPEPEPVAIPDPASVAVQQTIPQVLRQMLELFKQGDAGQAQLLECVDTLQGLGETLHWPHWAALTDTVQEILQQPDCTLATVALPILRDLKQSHQKLLSGSEADIVPSPDLLAFLPVLEEVPEDPWAALPEDQEIPEESVRDPWALGPDESSEDLAGLAEADSLDQGFGDPMEAEDNLLSSSFDSVFGAEDPVDSWDESFVPTLGDSGSLDGPDLEVADSEDLGLSELFDPLVSQDLALESPVDPGADGEDLSDLFAVDLPQVDPQGDPLWEDASSPLWDIYPADEQVADAPESEISEIESAFDQMFGDPAPSPVMESVEIEVPEVALDPWVPSAEVETDLASLFEEFKDLVEDEEAMSQPLPSLNFVADERPADLANDSLWDPAPEVLPPPQPAQDFDPTPLSLGADDEQAFTDLFDNAEALAAIEEVPAMAWTEPSAAAQEEWSEAAIEARADLDLADLFGDLTTDPQDEDAWAAEVAVAPDMDRDPLGPDLWVDPEPGAEDDVLNAINPQLFVPNTEGLDQEVSVVIVSAASRSSQVVEEIVFDPLLDLDEATPEDSQEDDLAHLPDPVFEDIDFGDFGESLEDNPVAEIAAADSPVENITFADDDGEPELGIDALFANFANLGDFADEQPAGDPSADLLIADLWDPEPAPVVSASAKDDLETVTLDDLFAELARLDEQFPTPVEPIHNDVPEFAPDPQDLWVDTPEPEPTMESFFGDREDSLDDLFPEDPAGAEMDPDVVDAWGSNDDTLTGLDDLFPVEESETEQPEWAPAMEEAVESATQIESVGDVDSLDLDGLFVEDPLEDSVDALDTLFGGGFGDPQLESEPFTEAEAPVSAGLDELDALFGEEVSPSSIPDTSDGFLEDFESQLDALMGEGEGDSEPRLDDLAALFDLEEASDVLSSISIPLASTAAQAAASSELDQELEAILGNMDLGEAVASIPTPVRAAVAPVAPAQTRRTAAFSNQTMRVEVRHLDQINNLVGELVVNRNSMEQNHVRLRQFLDGLLGRVQQLSDLGQQMQDQYDRSLLETALLSNQRSAVSAGSTPSYATGSSVANNLYGSGGGHSFDSLELDRFTAFHALSQEIIELIVRVRESSSDIEFAVDEAEQVARQFRQVTTQLQEGLNRARMVPFSQIADRLPRAIRDLSIKTGKQATLEVEGRDTSIDKAILEELYDPMTHLVNNALVHGIETPDVRKRAGKDPEGKIRIQAFYQGNQSIIIVSDDGGGIPVAKVKQKAVSLGILTPDASDDEVFNTLFNPGFSGRNEEEVDDLAGRGVGLDVVRRNISELRGSIQIDSTLGQGTTFTIRLPLTLSISKAMVCVSNKALIAFPLDGVEEMLDVPQDEIKPDEQGRPSIPWRDQRLHFQPLSQLLRFSRPHGQVYTITQDEGIIPIVVLQSSGHYVALQVDSFVEEQEIVIKQLRGPIAKPLGIAGATVLGNGRVLPIADILELVDLALGRIRRDLRFAESDLIEDTREQEHPTTVLIVDDSITVRELLSMSFNKVGYRVEQARDGQDAWEKLRGGLPCDIIFCDIEMPRMDGLQLLSQLRQDPHFQNIPIAMLTSRGAERHRQTARELGATAYFTKPYLEEELLSASARMLKGETLLMAAGS